MIINKDKHKVSIRKFWDRITNFYYKNYGEFLPYSEKKVYLKLIGNLKNKKIIDLGCGSGTFSVFLANKGATVFGIDFSIQQIKLAKKNLRKRKRVRNRLFFITKDIEYLKGFKDQSFDIAISVHTIHYVNNLNKSLKEIYRILKPGGKLIFSISHPFNHVIGVNNKHLTVTKSYFSKKAYKWNWGYPEDKLKVAAYILPRKISDYFKALRSAGFVVTHIIEPETKLNKNSFWYKQLNYRRELLPGVLIFCAYSES